MEPWPAESTNLSRLNQNGFAGLWCMNSFQSRYAIGAQPMGIPGWPELALLTASMDRKRIALIAVRTSSWLTCIGHDRYFSRLSPDLHPFLDQVVFSC